MVMMMMTGMVGPGHWAKGVEVWVFLGRLYGFCCFVGVFWLWWFVFFGVCVCWLFLGFVCVFLVLVVFGVVCFLVLFIVFV
jgi:hypothetical protein